MCAVKVPHKTACLASIPRVASVSVSCVSAGFPRQVGKPWSPRPGTVNLDRRRALLPLPPRRREDDTNPTTPAVNDYYVLHRVRFALAAFVRAFKTGAPPRSPPTPKTERLLPLLKRRRLLPPRLEDTGVSPKILLSTRVHPNPNPYLYALFYKCHLSYNLPYHHVALHFLGSGYSNHLIIKYGMYRDVAINIIPIPLNIV